jgi:hypothetical protein
MKKTPWFPANVMPKRLGLYECRRREFGVWKTRMLRWTALGWEYTDSTAGPWCYDGRHALMCKTDGDKWRGLTEPLK